jgi:ribulose 1,5-bisphosphate synthetase/thiazole synthase
MVICAVNFFLPLSYFHCMLQLMQKNRRGGKAMAMERLVVIGGDAAGMSAASQAKRRRPDLEIVVFERSPHTSFSA